VSDEDDEERLQAAAVIVAGLACSPVWETSFIARASQDRSANGFFHKTLVKDSVALLDLLEVELDK